MLLVAWATRTIDISRLLIASVGVGIGFFVVWLPVSLYYLAEGALAEFLYNYRLVPSRFARGYANTAYLGDLETDPYAVVYYALPYVVALMAICSVYRLRPLSVVAPLDGHRLLVFCACAALLAALPAALLRADQWHLIASLFALPLVVTVGLFHLPGVLTRNKTRQWIVRGTVIGVTLNLLLPVLLDTHHRLPALLGGRWHSFSLEADRLPPDASEIERRFGPSLLKTETRAGHLDLMRQANLLAGGRPTFVLLDRFTHGLVYAGYVYFTADLKPAPIWLERSDLVADDVMVETFLRHFEQHVNEVEVVISFQPDSPEIRLFKDTCGRVRANEIRTSYQSMFVFQCK